jgi:hypothetical protein
MKGSSIEQSATVSRRLLMLAGLGALAAAVLGRRPRAATLSAPAPNQEVSVEKFSAAGSAMPSHAACAMRTWAMSSTMGRSRPGCDIA